jgi:hypothetical protein
MIEFKSQHESILKDGSLLLLTSMLMLLVPFLLLQLPLLDLQYLLVRLPTPLTMQHHTSLLVDTVGDLGERIVTAIRAQTYLLIYNTELPPTEITLVNEPTNAVDTPAVQGQQTHPHLNRHVLDREISTDQ